VPGQSTDSAAAGFNNVYTIIDGFEGDKSDGSRKRLLWEKDEERLEELVPWVYDIDPRRIILEEATSKQTQ